MKAVRYWSANNARWLRRVYQSLETVLVALHPLLKRLGYQRLDRSFAAIEKVVKGFFFDSQSCGQCTLGETGMACPMNCPKTLRNGPCGGVRSNGHCEVDPDMVCVWVTSWEGSKLVGDLESTIQVIQAPVDVRLKGTSAWLRAVRKRLGLVSGDGL
tara:strand:+ start:574 stop:1044 length:471 start_codon:yes stop_codon:yes gene_type:complete